MIQINRVAHADTHCFGSTISPTIFIKIINIQCIVSKLSSKMLENLHVSTLILTLFKTQVIVFVIKVWRELWEQFSKSEKYFENSPKQPEQDRTELPERN